MEEYGESGIVYFIEKGLSVRKAYVAKVGNFYSLRFKGHEGEAAGIHLRKNRIYVTKEAVYALLKRQAKRIIHLTCLFR